jgi:hypothetical protein
LPGVALCTLACSKLPTDAGHAFIYTKLGIWAIEHDPVPRERQQLLPPQYNAQREYQKWLKPFSTHCLE